MESLIIWAAILALLFVVILVVNEVQKQQGGRPVPRKATSTKHRYSSRKHATLHKKLVAMTGNEEAARRLLLLARERNPNKPIEWVYEKAIFDLERDRGRY